MMARYSVTLFFWTLSVVLNSSVIKPLRKQDSASETFYFMVEEDEQSSKDVLLIIRSCFL
jgi:hypothetical protein